MIPEKFESLESFYEWFTASLPHMPIAPPMSNCVAYLQNNAMLVLFRCENYQVELINSAPNTEIPDHIHPHVDSFEVYLTGDISFRLNGKKVTDYSAFDEPLPLRMASHPLYSNAIRVRPSDWHGASIGPRGGSFLSIQRWPEGSPMTSVVDDWDGKTLDAVHRSRLFVPAWLGGGGGAGGTGERR